IGPDLVSRLLSRQRCSECPDPRAAQSLCTSCNKWLCYQCTDMHQHPRPPSQSTEPGAQQRTGSPPGSGCCGLPVAMCSLHKQEPLALLCETCDLMACSSCHLSSHKDHRVVHVGKALQDQQWLFENLVARAEEKRSAVENTAKQIEDRLHGLKVTQRRAENQIKMAKMIMMNELNKRANLLIEQLESVSGNFKQRLEDQMQGAIELCRQLDQVQNFIAWATAHHRRNPLLFSKEMITYQMQHLLEPQLHSDALAPVKIKFNWDASFWTKQISTLGTLTVEGGGCSFSEGVGHPGIVRPQPVTCLTVPSLCHRLREQGCAYQSYCQPQLCCLHCVPTQPSHTVPREKVLQDQEPLAVRCSRSPPGLCQNSLQSRWASENASPVGSSTAQWPQPTSGRCQDTESTQHQTNPTTGTAGQAQPTLSPPPQRETQPEGPGHTTADSSRAASTGQSNQTLTEHDSVAISEQTPSPAPTGNPAGSQDKAESQVIIFIDVDYVHKTERDRIFQNGEVHSSFILLHFAVDSTAEAVACLEPDSDQEGPEPLLLAEPNPEGLSEPAAAREEQEEAEMENEDFCAVCLIGGDLLCCDRCPKVFHLSCHVPSLLSFPTGDWVCSLCRSVQQPEVEYDCESPHQNSERLGKGQQCVLSACDQRKCEKLTLLIFTSVLSAPFHEPVSSLARHYYQIIKRPMDLSIIRSKLNRSGHVRYSTPEEFVADVFLMFRNCAKFNYPDSEVAQAGRNLETFFASKLREVFPDRAFSALAEESDSDEYEEIDRGATGGFPWPLRREQCHRKRKRRHSLNWRRHHF
uniref:Tripartite motif containing 66 n=1 Tax=Denticeps clupeoides TaxID=299321 RepID=A0AAY4BQV4_9TELE